MSETAASTTPAAIITGGSRGIGKACVLALAAAGFDTLFSYARNQQAAEATVREAEAFGRKSLAV